VRVYVEVEGAWLGAWLVFSSSSFLRQAGGTLGEAARDARLRAPAAAQHDMGILTHSLTDSRALALALTDS
jgi:hypothetical protein